MDEDDKLPPKLPWPADWKPRVKGSSAGVAGLLAVVGLGFGIFTDWPMVDKLTILVIAVLAAIFQDTILATASSARVALRRIQYYGRLHSRAEALQQDLARERTYVEGFAQYQLAQNQPPYLAVRDAFKTPKGDYVIVVEKGPALKLVRGERVLVVDRTTVQILATFQIAEERTEDYLAGVVSLRDGGRVWWGYIHQQVDSYAAINTKAVIMSLNARNIEDDE